MWVTRTSVDALFIEMLFPVDYMSEMHLILRLTIRSFLDLERDRVSGGLQQVDGLAQRFPL